MKRRKRDVIAVIALAITAGWSVASAFMAYGMSQIVGPKGDWATAARDSSSFVFFPPTLGLSAQSYIIVSLAISIATSGAVFFKKARDI